MLQLEESYKQLLKALETLNEIIICFENLKSQELSNNYETYEQAYAIHRDSLIQRFEFSTDLFWKYIKQYFETFHTLPTIIIPQEVISSAASAGLITHDEAEQILIMIKNRNKTSHMYIEEIADQLSKLIPNYYTLLQTIAHRLTP